MVSSDEDEPQAPDPTELINECKRHAYSNGEIFSIDINKSSLNGRIVGKCQFCTEKETLVRGSFKDSSNFISHIKVCLQYFAVFENTF